VHVVTATNEHRSPFVANGLAWLTWVYVLSFVGIMLLPSGPTPPPPLPSVFVGIANVHIFENDANGLPQALTFQLSRPLDFRLELPVTVTDGSARLGEHYAMRRRPRVIFEAGATHGVLSGDDEGCDVVITDDHELLDGEPRSFDITLGMVEGVAALDSSRSTCRVSIDDDEIPPTSRVKIRFASSGGELTESQVAGHSLSVQSEKAPEEKSEMTVAVQRQSGKEPTELGRKTFFLEPGQTGLTFRVSDVVPLEQLKAFGLADDDAPGPPSEFIVRLRGQHPLYADEPRDLTFRVTDNDPAAKLTMAIQDTAGQPLDRILPGSPFWVVADVDREIRLGMPLQVTLDKGGPIVTGTLAAGERSIRLGPLNASPGPERTIEVAMEVPAKAAARPFVEPAVPLVLPKGPKDAGRFAVIVVSTSRLREPVNGILEAVWKYMETARAPAYRNGLLLVGPAESIVLSGATLPAESDVFSPLVKDGQAVSAQLSKLLEEVSAVRQGNQDPTIRIVVVWTERGLESPGAASRLKPVDREKYGPISFLCPNADVDGMDAIRDALVGVGNADVEGVTVRCPDVDELSDHIRWAIDGFRPPGKTK
jgi:hypothetical protein